MNYAESHAAIRNALQFLGPLRELEQVYGRAAEAEKFLKDAGPRLLMLRKERQELEDGLAVLKADTAQTRANLEALVQDGLADVGARVAAVELQMGLDLARVHERERQDVESLKVQRGNLTDEIAGLQADYARILAEVGALKQERFEVRHDLTKIAERAGSHNG